MIEDRANSDVTDVPDRPALDADSQETRSEDLAGGGGLATNELAQEQAEGEPGIEERLAEAEAKMAEYLDGWQRSRAEFANARKRLEKERTEAYGLAGVQYVTKLLPVIDDLKRALDSAPENIVADPWFEGLDLVTRKFQSMMEAMDVRPIEALGQPFDPNLHEALALRDAEGVESGIVIEELQTGYRLGERVIRPSLVNVSA